MKKLSITGFARQIFVSSNATISNGMRSSMNREAERRYLPASPYRPAV